MFNMITHADSDASCVFVPSRFAFGGGHVTSFLYGEPITISSAIYNREGGTMTVKSPQVGRVICVLEFLSPSDAVSLCDAALSASKKGVAVRLGRVSDSGRKWFCAIVLADMDVPTEEMFVPMADTRPWAIDFAK